MTDLFTIVSIVLALCGSTYVGMSALHNYHRKNVEDLLKSARDCKDIITKLGKPKDIRRAKFKYTRILFHYFSWKYLYIFSIIWFILLAFAIAIHVWIAAWADPTIKLSVWPVYRWGFAFTVSLNFLSVLFSLLAPWSIAALHEQLEYISRVVRLSGIGPRV